nr:reverse transcriptase domain-containing protein [Tanacetum cinerariifolium]
NYNQGNTGFRPQMVANQIRPPEFPPVQSHQNNQTISIGRIVLIKTEVVISTNLISTKVNFIEPRYVKANDAVLRNMQDQGQNVQNQLANLTDMLSKFMSSNIASSSGSGTLPGNTITNPKEDLKGITTRSGVAYQGPTIPTSFKVVKHGTETGRALFDVHKGELTLRIENEAITYNLDQTSRYSANYDQITANKIDAIDIACQEYSQEVIGFFDVTTSGSPTPSDDPIVSTTSPTLTSFGDSDFLLFKEAGAFLGLEDDQIHQNLIHSTMTRRGHSLA